MSVFSVRLRVFVISVNTEKLRGHFHLHTATYCSWADLSNMLDIMMMCCEPWNVLCCISTGVHLSAQLERLFFYCLWTPTWLLCHSQSMCSKLISQFLCGGWTTVTLWYLYRKRKCFRFWCLSGEETLSSQTTSCYPFFFCFVIIHLLLHFGGLITFFSLIYWIILTVSFLDIQSDLFWSLRGNDSYF